MADPDFVADGSSFVGVEEFGAFGLFEGKEFVLVIGDVGGEVWVVVPGGVPVVWGGEEWVWGEGSLWVFGLTCGDIGGDAAKAADGLDVAKGGIGAAHVGEGADGLDVVEAFAKLYTWFRGDG